MARRSLIDTLLAPRIAALLDALPGALAGDVAAVHRTRVASRRLRELLPPMRELLAEGSVERARAEVRRVTRALGPVRELDVTTGLFEEFAASHDLDAAARLAVTRTLTRDRDRAQRRMRAALPERRRQRLEAALTALGGPEAPDTGLRLVAAANARVVRRGQRVRNALEHAGALYVPERLHQVRIAVKQLRYALEVAGDARRARPSARVTQLRQIQDLLGRAHDLHVLADRVRHVQAGVVRTSRATAAALGRVALALDEGCRAEHAAFMSRREGLLTLCDAIETAATTPRRQSVA
jgi:CHAD domain-containing protein